MDNLIHADCLDAMVAMDADSIDSIVTDPPYGLSFMGKKWDHGLPGIPFWAEAFRVAKPGAHLLAFGGTRTVHRLAAAIEDAGWEIRDMLVWGYASGFPKSHNLDGEWNGWGTALKPAWEPIVMARKPLRGTVAANVLRHGTGALNIDGTRIPGTWSTWRKADGSINHEQQTATSYEWDGERSENPAGRWPANVILTDPIFDGGIDGVVGGGETTSGRLGVGHGSGNTFGVGNDDKKPREIDREYGNDSGTYSRFFLIPKSARAEREPVLGGLAEQRGGAYANGEGMPGRTQIDGQWVQTDIAQRKPRANIHPTVKPLDLMRHLVRLVTPPGGTVLDPFLGSGTTALAAEMEGFAWVGIEKEAEYIAITEARLNGTQRGLGLVG